VDHSLGDLPAASGHQLAATATATLLEYYACVAEKQYPAAHAGLFQTGAAAPAPPINAIIFFPVQSSTLRAARILLNLRKKLNTRGTKAAEQA
jgi:hypothetical protein